MSQFLSSLAIYLPATVIAAIVLFICREFLEGRRRRLADRRTLKALKHVLSTECERNLWTISTLERALNKADEIFGSDPPLKFIAYQMPNGDYHWKTCFLDKQLKSGGALPPARRSAFTSSVLKIAELNDQLFDKLENGSESAAELEHLRGSLINFSNSDDAFDQIHFEGFPEWALEQLPEIKQSLSDLYLECTGQELKRVRLR